MFFQKTVFFALFVLFIEANAAPSYYKYRREVPQEHSHEKYLISVRNSLNLNNPDGIVDPVFGLLGNAAAANGAGNIADPNCLQQATADQAFTNAKAAGDVQGMTDALIFRALERNSLSVGATTEPCTTITAVNPEIAAISQHQDPASPNAAAVNKAITLELAKQIASIGGDPQLALESGTFAPGQIGDPTARGNSCNDETDTEGCIFSQGLLVEDATPEEIDAAVAGVAVGGNNGGNEGATGNEGNAGNEGAAGNEGNTGNEAPAPVDGTCPPVQTVTVTADAPAATPTGGAGAGQNNGNAGNNNNNTGNNSGNNAGNANEGAAGENLQKFQGALGGASAPAVTRGGRGFQVANNADFLNLAAALGRSCDVQKNLCANLSNSGQGDFSVGDCDAQGNECRQLIQ